MKITTFGIDLARDVFQVHGVDERSHVVLRKQIRRDQFATFMVNLLPCQVGMKACGSAHDRARKLYGVCLSQAARWIASSRCRWSYAFDPLLGWLARLQPAPAYSPARQKKSMAPWSKALCQRKNGKWTARPPAPWCTRSVCPSWLPGPSARNYESNQR